MKTDLDCVIHAAKIVCNSFVHSEQMILFYNELCRLRDEIVSEWEEQSPLPEVAPIPEEWKLPERGIDETDAEVRERVKANTDDADYWDMICPKGHFMRCATEHQKNLWWDAPYPIERCPECFNLYSWGECTFKPHQVEEKPVKSDPDFSYLNPNVEECSHLMQDTERGVPECLHCEYKADESESQDHPFGVKIDGSRSCGGSECDHDWQKANFLGISEYCTKCDDTRQGDRWCSIRKCWVSADNQYHSGKDALDKLMRGECDRLVFDHEFWIKQYSCLYTAPDGWLLSPVGREFVCFALCKIHFNEQKWLCLKDEK